MDKNVIGISDVAGIELYYDKKDVSSERIDELFDRAVKNQDRVACYFEAVVSEELDKEVVGLLKVSAYVDALRKLKGGVKKLWLPVGEDWKIRWDRNPAGG